MSFATYQVAVGDKKDKINLKVRYTQKGSIVISTQYGDIIDLLPEGGVEVIVTPGFQVVMKESKEEN